MFNRAYIHPQGHCSNFLTHAYILFPCVAPRRGPSTRIANLVTTGKFIPTRRTPGVSTSELLERIVSGYRNRDFDEKLTKMGHAELRAEGSDYDGQSRRESTNVSRAASPGGSKAASPTRLSVV